MDMEPAHATTKSTAMVSNQAPGMMHSTDGEEEGKRRGPREERGKERKATGDGPLRERRVWLSEAPGVQTPEEKHKDSCRSYLSTMPHYR
jgi:hypothetical protein